MESLIFKYKGQALSKVIMGACWILFGLLTLLFMSDDPITQSDWMRSTGYFLIGTIFFTPLTGKNETSFLVREDNLKIKWRTRIREIVIRETEIDKIILKSKKIEIQRKERKPIVLSFGEWQWKVEDKTKVYEFMIEYAHLKNLVVEK